MLDDGEGVVPECAFNEQPAKTIYDVRCARMVLELGSEETPEERMDFVDSLRGNQSTQPDSGREHRCGRLAKYVLSQI